MKIKYLFFLIFTFLFFNCEYKPSIHPTRGKTHVLISEDISPVFIKQINEFERYYSEAKISYGICSAREAVVQLLNDSVKLIAIPRELNQDEWEVVKKYNLYIDTFNIAFDGVVVIQNKFQNKTEYSTDDLKEILNGQKQNWSDGSKLIVAMENQNSGVYNFLTKNFLQKNKIGAIIYPCSTSTQVVDIVEKNKSVLGFIASSWNKDFQNNIKIVSIGDKNFQRDTTGKMEYFEPHPAHIYRNYYPLKRKIYLVGRSLSGGVEDGFITFVSSVNGQKIFVNNNLVPATMPVRLISLTSE
ncbi:MAG: substrate-binding domain-containing protein [Bacteroidetes bacterium]|nr:substrate-binding domain-containing protein [Bacteroidota bacterium]